MSKGDVIWTWTLSFWPTFLVNLRSIYIFWKIIPYKVGKCTPISLPKVASDMSGVEKRDLENDMLNMFLMHIFFYLIFKPEIK